MSRRTIELPPFATQYLSETTRTHAKRVVAMFHGWLARTGLDLRAVRGADLERFASGPSGRPVAQMTRNNYRYEVRLYLRWLEQRGLAGPFAEEELDGFHRKSLPDEVRRFLRFLAPIRRPATVTLYRGVLRKFHEFLDERGCALTVVGREECLAWAQKLHEKGIHPATRVGMLVCVRKYFDWLWEHGIASSPGHEMILGKDLPKKPEYLPRPLPPDVDRELQDRLAQSELPIGRGLYVMRRTGLRLGELRRLERDCVRTDHGGNSFLKVPLGKLNTERLVPLDGTTLAAIRELQALAPSESQWLIAGARQRPVSPTTYRTTLVKLSGDLRLQEPLTTHRLRHSFATSLMNGGMSLLGIMKLLGHRDQRMTLRYTQIADETVGREYFEALTRISERYEILRSPLPEEAEPDPAALIDDVIRWVTKHLRSGALDRRARLLIRRLEAGRDELLELLAIADEES